MLVTGCPEEGARGRAQNAPDLQEEACAGWPQGGMGMGGGFERLQMVRVPRWQTVGGSFICIPNKLRILFFPLKSPGKKWGQEEWQTDSPCWMLAFVSWGPWMGFQRRMSSEAPGIKHTSFVFAYFVYVCVWGTKDVYVFLSAPQRSL